ncbi:site-specific integrase [Maridesulfovibrio sp.]|uniref:tyrosine-type recombinase/integrase n=1 Tax=Maridesulfovibrio sp. TaxID=2795000 RepID=UPI002AA6FD11|nr:site-specific integrase [Maridesulfovibrio sp.]
MATRPKWNKTKYPGVRYREHETRKHGIQPDKYFTITYKYKGKTETESIGWASQGVKAQDAANVLSELKVNQTQGKFPQTLKQKKEMAAAELEEQEARDRAEKDKSITFDEIWAQFYRPQAEANKAAKSWKREESLHRIWISPAIGDCPFACVSATDLEKIKTNMSEKGRSPRSIQYALATVRQVYNVAKNLDIFKGDNPVKKIKMPKMDNRRTRFLSEDEADQLLGVLLERNPLQHCVSLVSLYCGLRAGEIIDLEWKDLNFAEDMILIRDAKNGFSRHAFMTKQVKKELRELRKQIDPDQKPVFSAQRGKKLNEVSRLFNEAVDELGLNVGIDDRRQKVVFHTLRHTFASWLVQRGTPLYTVAKLMGHSTLAMTERYAHLAPDNLKAAVAVLEN